MCPRRGAKYETMPDVQSRLKRTKRLKIMLDKEKLIRSLAEAYTAAWCSQNAASVAACYEENGSLSVNEDAPAVGRKAIAEVAQGFMN